MAMEFKKKTVLLSGTVDVQDAEKLLEWLQGKSHARVDLSACTHLHPANLQVLLAAGVTVSAWPVDDDLALWLQSAMVGSK